MRDIDAGSNYSQGNESEFRREVVKDISSCYRSGQDVFIAMDQRFCLQASDGSWFRIEISPGGTPIYTPVTP